MKRLLILAVMLLAGCTHTTYTEAKRADGTTVKHIAIAPGTKITTASGGCIDSTGAAAECPIK
ncbi:TPA: hypothetical protein JWK76_002491 [Escherichia coli]|uniref:hypothetical protein n=1 Tax=Escherichia coli TaxID=562 RepID=UPI000224408D|nr:hypothetical protein [Escherichia coli]EES3796573.1 hypothetical protein [Escherichia coli]EFC9842916.1 hypothetical protein [Escherichia coli]EFG2177020.1 hypothetical protein [Escherichia coli]EFJ5712531.1 hypothetical protein [Escherichia coli]EFK1930366.1 hypothetical protein [Escherichia coli]